MFSNILGGAAGFPVADLGDTVSQSLRFRGAQVLSREFAASNTEVCTFSAWIKRSNLDSSNVVFGAANGATNFERIVFNPTNTLSVYGQASGSDVVNVRSSALWRDPSAWYNLVYVKNTPAATASERIRLYINGAEITGLEASTYPSQDSTTALINSNVFHMLGRDADTAADFFEGYMADVYFIDGQSLDPTEFGRYQEDGVWVPKNYTGTYGTNGFHLDFADSSDLGNDVSGNNNDFTASGFDTADVALYSKDLFTNASTATPNYNTTDKTFLASNGADKAFDGSTSTQASTTYSPNTGTWIIFRPSTAIVANSSVQVRTYYNETITVNEVDTGLSNPSSSTISTVDISSALTFPVTIQTIGLRGNSSGSLSEARVFQIIVDGTVLVDNTDNDVDYNDTPTSNYATFNTVHTDTAGGATLEEGNLFLSATGGATRYVDARSTIPASECNCYVEMYVRTKSGSNALIGIGVGDHESRISLGTGAYVCYRQNGGIIEYPGNTTLGTESSYDAGDVIGMTVNSTQVAFYKNGTLEGTYNHGLTGDFFVIGMAYDNGHNSEVEFNFGQRNFIYTIPTGFSALQTNNLPEPTIKNGKDHFNILTWTGTGTTNALTGLGFQPDLVWVKKRGDTTESHDLQDSIRGAGERLRTNSPDISRTIAGTIDSFDSDGFTVDDAGTTNESGKTYVAWCWKAGGTAVSNTDGSTTSTVSANTDAGFSIVKYTGTSANATVGHGLNSPPEFIIFKDYTDLNEENWAIWFNGFNVSTGEHLAFNTSGLDTLSTLLNGTAPTSSVIHLGNNVLINDNGEDVIAYCWHSVEGYSKFGSYTGNGSADGSFVYLGFRPAWILRKDIDSTNEWTLIDSTRSPNNPTNETLVPNAADAEDGDFDIDILSNGFKCRTSESAHNRNGGTYVYACFAENPFGGENAPPVTAR